MTVLIGPLTLGSGMSERIPRIVTAMAIILFVAPRVWSAHYANTVLTFAPGQATADQSAGAATGTCDNVSVSLGHGGVAAFGFNKAFNLTGADIHITERATAEGYQVLASNDGGQAFPIDLGSAFGPADFSLPAGVHWVDAIKIIDDNIEGGDTFPNGGVDIDCINLLYDSPVILSTTFKEALDANPNIGGGKRIFAEANALGGVVNTVTIVVEINPPAINIPIFFRSYDVDDPSTSSILDPNGSAQDDNLGTPNKGRFSTGSDQITVNTDANGRAEAVFSTTKNPGDNSRIGASTQNDLPLLYNGTSIPANRRTDMLTVWRTLHIERDGMAAYSVMLNEVDGTIDHRVGSKTVEVVGVLPDEQNRFEGGILTIDGANYTVNSNTDSGSGNDRVTVNETLATGIDGISYHLKDDDSIFGGAPLPLFDLSTAMTAYAEAYVVVQLEPSLVDQTVTFDPNLESNEFDVATAEQRDQVGSEDYWLCLILSGFQDQALMDIDPGSQPGIAGRAFTGVNDPDFNRVAGYKETLREGTTPEERIVAHEMGHVFGLDHSNGWIMKTPSPTSDQFHPADQRKIRSVTNP